MKLEKWAYSPAEFSERTGVSITTVYTWIKKGQLDAVKMEHRLLIPAESIETFLHQTSRGSVLP